MEHNDHNTGILNLMISIISATISIASIQAYISLIAGMTAIISAIFAARYYYHKTNEILNRNK
jgi:hypothetical protein